MSAFGSGGNSSGGANAPGASTNTGDKPLSNIFGSTTGGGSGLFGSGTAGSSGGGSSTGGLFGGTSSTAAPSTTSSFGGGSNATAPSATSLFGGGSNATAPSATSLFGGGSNATAQPATSLLGGGSSSTTPSATGLFGGGSSTSAPTTGLFGSGNASTSTPSTTNPLFGGSGAFSSSKPADQNSSGSVKPSSFFNLPSAPSSIPSTGGLFGLGSKPAENTTSNATPTAGGTSAFTSTSGTLGGGLFGKPASTSSATSTSGSTNKEVSAAPTGGLFGSSTNVPEKKDTPQSGSTTPSFGLFGAPKTTEKKDEPTAAGDATAIKSAEKIAGTPGSLNTTSGPSNTTVAVPPPSMLRGKTLEEIVNRWSTELETHVKEFGRFAGEVAVWDRALIENGNNLGALYSHVLAAERQQNDIDQSLDHIEQQQKDLASTLDAYERVSQDVLGGKGASLMSLDTGPADTERDKNYMLATDLHTQLDDLSGSLAQMIDSVNALSLVSKPNGGLPGAEDPMAQISQILSSHLESLQWIDGAVREVEGKVSEIEKRVKESGQSISNGAPKSRGFGLSR